MGQLPDKALGWPERQVDQEEPPDKFLPRLINSSSPDLPFTQITKENTGHTIYLVKAKANPNAFPLSMFPIRAISHRNYKHKLHL